MNLLSKRRIVSYLAKEIETVSKFRVSKTIAAVRTTQEQWRIRYEWMVVKLEGKCSVW